MSAHSFISCILFSHSTHQKNCLDIENNHKFMTSEFKYILYVCAYRWVGGLSHPFVSNIARMKNGFPKSPSRIYNRWCEIFFAEICMGVVAENGLKGCVFFAEMSCSYVRMLYFCIFRQRHISKHLSNEYFTLSFSITAHVRQEGRFRIKYIHFSLHLFNFRKTVWRCRSVAIGIEN
jgi:hypothetical protein